VSVRTVLQRAEPPFVWLDVVGPTAEELDEVARGHGLHPLAVMDCLDPEHLPKFEQFDGYSFVIIRAFDEQSAKTCATVQELTRKVAIFAGPAFLITIHRTDQRWLAALAARLESEPSLKMGKEGPATYFLTQVLNGAVDTYLAPMEAIEARIDAFEELVFGGRDSDARAFAEDLREIHVLKRQVTLIKRLLWRTLDVVQRMTPATGRAGSLLLLTVFSVFFLPLTFLVGVYGMNFDFMPELRSPWGYPLVLAAMGAITLTIYLWFRRRGWLRE